MTTPEVERIPVVVIGGGQAGLSVSWHLARRGLEHVILERETVAHDWIDRRWDAFTLVTPNFQCRLPGFAYDGDEPDGFMTAAETHAWLRRYAATFDPPVREGVAVLGLTRGPEGFVLRTTHGEILAEQVVIATGGYHLPHIPPLSGRLPPRMQQVHSAGYRSADALAAGAVLVVGSGQSGAQIAEDLHLAGRVVHLAIGRAPRSARSYRGRDTIAWLEEMGVYDVTVAQHVGGVAKRESTNHYMTGRAGGHDIDLRRFALEGMRLSGRLRAIDGERVLFDPTLARDLDHADSVMDSIKDDIDAYIASADIPAPREERYVPVWRPATEPEGIDLAEEGVGAVVWATGFHSDYRWVDVGVFDGRGAPVHHGGRSETPGLFFLGLPWLTTWGSGRFAGVAVDAERIVGQLAQGARIAATAAG